jgi:hypothetical protein
MRRCPHEFSGGSTLKRARPLHLYSQSPNRLVKPRFAFIALSKVFEFLLKELQADWL